MVRSRTTIASILAFFCLTPLLALPAVPAVTAPALRAGKAALLMYPTGQGQFGVALLPPEGDSNSAAFRQATPLAVEIVDGQGTALWLTGGYESVTKSEEGYHCAGNLTSPNHSTFLIVDSYRSLPRISAFTLTRRVEVVTANSKDAGFSSRFSFSPAAPTVIGDCDFFAPGLWYKDNAHVPPSALASQPGDHVFLFREDRLPLPIIMQRDKRSGLTVALAHLGGNPTTFTGEDGLNRIIDARLGFGSLGVLNADRPSPVFQFPGTEGERTYIYGASLKKRWAYRSHPITAGFSQQYRLLIQVGRTSDFPAAVRQAWRTVYTLQNPPVIPANLTKVYQNGIALLGSYTHAYHGIPSVPFAATVPDGKVVDTSSQMGFVGQALPAAFLLIQDSLAQGKLDTLHADTLAHASAVVDFWTQHAMTPSGMPKTWVDIHADGTYTFRNYHTFLRVSSDGVEGALQCWNVMHQHGQERPDWLEFCRRYGDWLLSAQNPDGSFSREYGFDGLPIDRSKATTDQPIRFLVDLFFATGDARYRAAALHAGGFCLGSVHEAYAYVGGTPDNPDVMDKEAGMMALDAFLSLYDMTGDKCWLAAATQAAWYSETWVYSWNIPVPSDDLQAIFPKNRTTFGLSLIAAGQSGADTYMSAAPFLFYRLFLLTGEPHFLEMARMLLNDTKQELDWDGTLGYAFPGLQAEALSLTPRRGHGVTHWLPWLTVAQLVPLVNLRSVFGSISIDEIEKLSPADRIRRNKQFAGTHGFLALSPVK